MIYLGDQTDSQSGGSMFMVATRMALVKNFQAAGLQAQWTSDDTGANLEVSGRRGATKSIRITTFEALEKIGRDPKIKYAGVAIAATFEDKPPCKITFNRDFGSHRPSDKKEINGFKTFCSEVIKSLELET